MKEALYINDCYLKEFDATVKNVKDDKYIVLDKTVFYPNSGGQPHDTGKFIDKKGDEYNVVFVGNFGRKTSHEVDREGLKQDDEIKGVIDWDRRYIIMRMHTAAHVLSRVLYNETGANTAGNQLGVVKSRIDFTLDDFDREKIIECVNKANEIIKKGGEVKKKFMSKEETQKIDGFAAPSPHLVQDFDTLRVVDIKDVDAQPCGGTHLDNIKEIGKIVFLKAENKGKNNRRIYYTVE